MNPIGRVFYAASTLICTPASLSQEVGVGLGAQAGEARLGEVAKSAGFTSFRRASETPFNLVFLNDLRAGGQWRTGLFPFQLARSGRSRRKLCSNPEKPIRG